MTNNVKILKGRYNQAKSAKVGDEIMCPSCGTKFIKTHYQQKFCKTYGGSVCKDNYWNNVTPHKRNNKTRISPASAAFMASRSERNFNPDDYEHPHSSEALGQWND